MRGLTGPLRGLAGPLRGLTGHPRGPLGPQGGLTGPLRGSGASLALPGTPWRSLALVGEGQGLIGQKGLAPSTHPKPIPNSHGPISPCPRSASRGEVMGGRFYVKFYVPLYEIFMSSPL